MKIPKIKSHTFFKKKYRIMFGSIKENTSQKDLEQTVRTCGLDSPDDILALTDDRGTKNQTILISDTIEDDQELLRVLLDEGLHACDDRLDNSIVDKYATDLSRFLWRCGYRRIS